MKSNSIPLLTALLLFSLTAPGQNEPSYRLQLSGGIKTPVQNISAQNIFEFNQKVHRVNGKAFVAVQFEKIPTDAERKQLVLSGVQLHDYISGNAYTATILNTIDAGSLQLANARAIFELTAEDKMQAPLAKGYYPAWSVKIPGTIDVWISFPASFSFPEVQEKLRQHNFDLQSARFKDYRILELRIATGRIHELVSFPFIEYVQPVPHEDQLLNNRSRYSSRANIANGSLAVGGRNLHGEGVVIGIGDNADAQNHIDFTGRVISRFGASSGQHGLHVAGTAGGAGILTDTLAGYAPKATLLIQVLSHILDNAPTYVQDYGMALTNNSYGNVVGDCGYNGLYDLYSRIIDQQAFDLPGLTHVFAAGNSGGMTCSPYPTGFSTVLGSYQSTKNALIVGATSSAAVVTGFSSKGPVKDGRIKPDITTQGFAMISSGFGSYWNNSGTSMAAPGATGGLALLYQRYKQLNSESNPKNGLIKNIVCNTATDKGNEGPDYTYGFGWMNVGRALEVMENNRYLTATVANNITNTHTVTIPPNTAQVKLMLYWNDPAASAVVNSTLVNDLDLEVTNPSNATVLPRVLDTLPFNVNNIAGTGADHINNIEQVTINNPATGTYTVKVKGTAVTQNPAQEYFVSWDIIPVSTKITFPIGEENFRPGQMITIQWESYGSASSYTLQYSTDDGNNWVDINNNVPAGTVQYNWVMPSITSDQVRVRIINNTTTATSSSAAFTLLGLPVVTLAPVQCEDYISINWTAIAGATDYEVMRLLGDDMMTVAVLPNTATGYIFSGLSKDSVYWVSVRPRLNGKPGRRATSISRQPNSGTCSGTISDNDIKLDAIGAPANSGRKFTSTELGNNIPVTIRIKNLDDAATTGNINVSYSLNGGAPVIETIVNPGIAPGAFFVHSFGTPVDLSAIGSYSLQVTVTGTGDINPFNNSITKAFKQLDNPSTTLTPSFLDNIETTASQIVQSTQAGLVGADRYDYSNNNALGRLRTFLNTGIAFSGSRAFTLDVSNRIVAGNTNYLDGTYNLAAYNTSSDEVRLDFRYKHHGQIDHANNKVWIRGDDTQPWIQVYDLFANQTDIGVFKKTGSIEVSDFLNNNVQNFSSSFQARWGQWGQVQAADDKSGAGYTIDDIQLYRVTDDIQMISIDSPYVSSCGLNTAVPVKITLRNSMSTARNNIPVKMRIDGGAIISENISTVAGNTSSQYSFIATASLNGFGNHTIQVWVDYPADSYRQNDTTSIIITNNPVISSFPYLENFENNNGSWYSGGKKSSWEYGTPASYRIKGAASGSKAWKTRLVGAHNDEEISYLYSPCFNISGMSNPTLSFSVALDLEDCGAGLCDAAYAEYSTDGTNWIKLGATGQGVNWYNKNYSGNQLWSIQNYSRWHVATIPLPAGLSQLRLRFVLASDPAVGRDGIAVDDIHIYNNPFGIYDGITMATPVSQTVNGGNNWVDFIASGKLIASVQPNNQNLGNTNAQAFISTPPADRYTNGQYYHNRNIIISPAVKTLNDSVTVRFYFLDNETDSLIFATGCTYCSKPSQFTQLGITKYNDSTGITENGLLTDNGPGNWNFYPAGIVTKVPFDKGYYAEFKTTGFSEFWLNDGGIDKAHAFPVDILNFRATKQPLDNVLVEWTSAFEFGISRFEVELAKGNSDLQLNNFVNIGTVTSTGNSSQPQNYNYTDTEAGKSGVRYYRLKIIHQDGMYSYSTIKPVVFNNELTGSIYPNPSSGIFNLSFQAADGEKIQAKVYDAKGRELRSMETIANGFVQKFIIDLSDERIPAALYLIQVRLGEIRKTFRVIKQ